MGKSNKSSNNNKSGGSKTTDSGENKIIRLVSVVICFVAVGVGLVRWRGLLEKSLTSTGVTDATPGIAAEETDSSVNGRVTDHGFVRWYPNVTLMGEDERAEYEVSDPTELPFVDYLSSTSMGDRRERPMGAKFRNFMRHDLTMWWDDGSEEGVYSGMLRAGGNTQTNTYTTHVFIFRRRDNGEEVGRFEMRDDQHLMLIGPEENDEEMFQSVRYKEALEEANFMRDYYEKNGVPWLSYYPRGPPILKMWPADFVGQRHRVRSYVGYFHSETEQSQDPIDFEVVVISTTPRAFLIENILSPFERDLIVSLGDGVVGRSRVGSSEDGFQSDTRTSENGWISRYQNEILDIVYYRLADILRMTDAQMHEGRNGNLENLQYVRYLQNQHYQPHHDFGAGSTPAQRFSTLLMYLHNAEEGGATSFPKALNGRGIKVKPPDCSGVLFYSMLPDGNGDDMSLHSGMSVQKGVKKLCNLWSWDPKYKEELRTSPQTTSRIEIENQ